VAFVTTATSGRDTGKAARILAAAEELLPRRGFNGVTMTEVAQKAHVGKGTAYLYWPTKEALFLELLARSFQSILRELAETIPLQPDLALPGRLCPWIVEAALSQPLVRALHTSDGDLLGVLTDDPRSEEILRRQGMPAVIRDLLPLWRRHGLACTDQSEEQQAFSLHAFTLGLLEITARGIPVDDLGPAGHRAAAREAIDTLLGSSKLSPGALATVAEETTAVLTAAADRTPIRRSDPAAV
jgi:AcrR family transcriptional regulator